MIVAGLLALAMIASLLLIFSESVQLLRVGVVVALWAATVGAIAMNKYRRESALDRAKADDLKTVYELQLQREIAARREYELTVEEKVRADLKLDAGEMAALRTELATLRRTLEMLFDGRLPDDVVALEGQAEKLRGLSEAARVSAPRPSGPAFASPDDEPVTAETESVEAAMRAAEASEKTSAKGDVEEPRAEKQAKVDSATGKSATGKVTVEKATAGKAAAGPDVEDAEIEDAEVEDQKVGDTKTGDPKTEDPKTGDAKVASAEKAADGKPEPQKPGKHESGSDPDPQTDADGAGAKTKGDDPAEGKDTAAKADGAAETTQEDDEDDHESSGRRSRRRRADGEGRTVAEILASLSAER
ncbi:membrane protein [Rhodococcus pyridinivorans SB3094]|uniref:Membrane protein n=2 Tax=Nocardiaceae TaxID=85025 RepID=V9XGC0_9NOCA|nr:membrane protein [Rhodococcus pyridinivorans SB3094]